MNKYSYNKHFLDSNILIGRVILWDNFNNDCNNYFEKKWSRNTSERVYEECEKVISRYRKLQGHFLESFKEYLDGTNKKKLMFEFDSRFNSFVSHYIRTNLREGNSFDLPEDKFKNSVLNFTGECSELIRNAVITSSYESLVLECRYYFNDAIEELESVCYDSDIVTTISESFETYDGVYPRYEKKLKDMGIHKPDNRIILDCHYFMENEFGENTAFITKDKTILKARPKIEKLLNEKIVNGTYIHTI